MNKTLIAGRVLMSVIFILSALMKIFMFSGQVAYARSMGVPLPAAAIVVALIIELACGVAILTGFQTAVAAWVLFAYLIPVTLFFHTHFSDQNQLVHFLKNLAIMGGLLILASRGNRLQSGAIRVDKA